MRKGLKGAIHDPRRRQPQGLKSKSKAVWNEQFWYGLVPSSTGIWSWQFESGATGARVSSHPHQSE
jgi:hypothetical protein